MKVSNRKGIANHLVPESCLDDPQGRREALTGESAGVLMSSEIIAPGSRPGSVHGNTKAIAPLSGEGESIPAESKNHGMYGNFLRGNRETRQAPSPLTYGGGWCQ